jgi:hypothetical protein
MCSRPAIAKGNVLPWIDSPEPEVKVKGDGPPPPPRWYHDKLGWAFTGVGAVVLSYAAYLVGASRDAEALARTSPSLVVRAQQQLVADTRRTDAYVFGGVGVTLMALGVVRFVVDTDGSTKAAAAVWGRF